MIVDTLRNAEIDPDITFVIYGAGSLGSQILENLVKMGFQHIIVYDKDIVESHNISSTIYNNHMIGMTKVEACGKIIQNRYGLNILYSTEDNFFRVNINQPVIYISATDNYAARIKALENYRYSHYRRGAFIDCRTSAWESNITCLLGKDNTDYTRMRTDIETLIGGGDGTGLSKGCGTKVVTQTGVHIVNAMVTQAILEINNSFDERTEVCGTFTSNQGYYKRILNHKHAGLIFGADTFAPEIREEETNEHENN